MTRSSKEEPVVKVTTDVDGVRTMKVTATFHLPLPKTPQTAKAYFELFEKRQWIYLRKLCLLFKKGLKELARKEREKGSK